jgi:hypothetical protein
MALAALCAALVGLAAPASEAQAQTRYTPPELEQLLAPIALYPDSVLAQVLMASAYPAEVQLAAEWLRRNPTFKDKGDAVPSTTSPGTPRCARWSPSRRCWTRWTRTPTGPRRSATRSSTSAPT